MPNWVSCTFELWGDKEIIYAIEATLDSALTDHAPLFQSFYPCPEFGEAALDWRNEYWGTKWGDCDLDFSTGGHEGHTAISGSFNTAWSPGLPFWEHFHHQYPTLSGCITFEEEGLNYPPGFFLLVPGQPNLFIGEYPEAQYIDDDIEGIYINVGQSLLIYEYRSGSLGSRGYSARIDSILPDEFDRYEYIHFLTDLRSSHSLFEIGI